ncbi:DUF6875 domain-containing protein [Nocardia macrotermitis]|uniref:DUF6875 domain-containing protein n=1 Tax=Nocardia macrotermitis TaxID=2585198 RepID=A0A7K0D322_9NOCA|nr:hypothetical protein [Nocardia macrotermitis]MQY20057.1 hypothetical protein [Nocardia macrotermitis]
MSVPEETAAQHDPRSSADRDEEVRTGSDTGVRWRRLYRDRDSWARLDPAAADFTRWVDGHLTHPHPDLGRDGPVCPFVHTGVAHGLLWAGLADGGDGLDTADLRRIVADALAQYRELCAEDPDRVRQLALVTLFPGLTRYERIDAAHLACKSEVVRHGFMLGQFYPGCGVPGLWNREFHPLDAPVPMLVLRPMMSTDYPFLAGRAEWLYAYLTHLAPDLPRRLRWAIAERMLVEGAAVADITALRAHARDEHAR